MADVVKLGSLYLDSPGGIQPTAPAGVYSSAMKHVGIGDTFEGREISWVKYKDLLVADRLICIDISWNKLNEFGFIFGTPVKIDGKYYLCRSLKLAGKIGPSEWDDILDDTDDTDKTWHWSQGMSWGQAATGSVDERVVCGYSFARFRDKLKATYRSHNAGWRPVLEPLKIEIKNIEKVVGRKISLLTASNDRISGNLVTVSDYDLVIKSGTILHGTSPWVVRDRTNIIVNRAGIVSLKKM